MIKIYSCYCSKYKYNRLYPFMLSSVIHALFIYVYSVENSTSLSVQKLPPLASFENIIAICIQDPLVLDLFASQSRFTLNNFIMAKINSNLLEMYDNIKRLRSMVMKMNGKKIAERNYFILHQFLNPLINSVFKDIVNNPCNNSELYENKATIIRSFMLKIAKFSLNESYKELLQKFAKAIFDIFNANGCNEFITNNSGRKRLCNICINYFMFVVYEDEKNVYCNYLQKNNFFISAEDSISQNNLISFPLYNFLCSQANTVAANVYVDTNFTVEKLSNLSKKACDEVNVKESKNTLIAVEIDCKFILKEFYQYLCVHDFSQSINIDGFIITLLEKHNISNIALCEKADNISFFVIEPSMRSCRPYLRMFYAIGNVTYTNEMVMPLRNMLDECVSKLHDELVRAILKKGFKVVKYQRPKKTDAVEYAESVVLSMFDN